MGEDVYIIGVGMIKFGKWLQKSIKDMTGEALELALKDCGLTRDDIQAAWFSNTMWGMYSFQHSIRGQVALTANGLEGIPITNVENACASASTALHGAWTAIKAGLYDCLLAIGAEKLYDEDRAKVMRSFMAGTDVEVMAETAAKLREAEMKRREKEVKEKGSRVQQEKAGGHSAFMDFYAAGARAHMEKYGSTQRQLAVIAAKAHNNSTLNPLAQYTFPQTVEQVLEDRVVAYPLTRAMCAPIGDGAAAAVICSERFLKKHSSDRAVKIRASVLEGGNRIGPGDISERASKKAYEITGLGPEDIDVMEVHDATAFGEISQMESLGFCPPGEGGVLAESGATALDGKIPVNPSGGLISRGHPIGASGLAQIYELVTQLRGEAGKRQVKNHRFAMAENGGGTIGRGEAAMAIHILEKV
ncbi:MAG: thiolase family protein [Deltaproteobacteria bacterium]|nr:thiolase family protein [Deltaproteobacteria bacterium]